MSLRLPLHPNYISMVFFFCFFGSAFDSFLSHQKIKVWDKESPKLLLGQCAWKDILGKMMARKQLSKSDFEHS